eukprot:comp18905_c0_seq2/m.21044 comp18905_c0_seq2/g.21044  ORF comp18905_c0_seq2/g.21044 comp18905_c0_seq2/m.21044 type:complete len:618 (-) comp18905_c0_seq2:329-2182(-)
MRDHESRASGSATPSPGTSRKKTLWSVLSSGTQSSSSPELPVARLQPHKPVAATKTLVDDFYDIYRKGLHCVTSDATLLHYAETLTGPGCRGISRLEEEEAREALSCKRVTVLQAVLAVKRICEAYLLLAAQKEHEWRENTEQMRKQLQEQQTVLVRTVQAKAEAIEALRIQNHRLQRQIDTLGGTQGRPTLSPSTESFANLLPELNSASTGGPAGKVDSTSSFKLMSVIRAESSDMDRFNEGHSPYTQRRLTGNSIRSTSSSSDYIQQTRSGFGITENSNSRPGSPLRFVGSVGEFLFGTEVRCEEGIVASEEEDEQEETYYEVGEEPIETDNSLSKSGNITPQSDDYPCKLSKSASEKTGKETSPADTSAKGVPENRKFEEESCSLDAQTEGKHAYWGEVEGAMRLVQRMARADMDEAEGWAQIPTEEGKCTLHIRQVESAEGTGQWRVRGQMQVQGVTAKELCQYYYSVTQRAPPVNGSEETRLVEQVDEETAILHRLYGDPTTNQNTASTVLACSMRHQAMHSAVVCLPVDHVGTHENISTARAELSLHGHTTAPGGFPLHLLKRSDVSCVLTFIGDTPTSGDGHKRAMEYLEIVRQLVGEVKECVRFRTLTF